MRSGWQTVYEDQPMGTYIKFDDFGDCPDYAEAVRYTDLGDAAGADGLILVERLTVFGWDDKDKVGQALDCVGLTYEDLRGKGKNTILLMLADALLSYGWYDPAPSYHRPSHWCIVSEDYGPWSDKRSWDGWEVDIDQTVRYHKQYGCDMREYMMSEAA